MDSSLTDGALTASEIRAWKHRTIGVAMHILALMVMFQWPTLTDLGLFLFGIVLGGTGLSLGYHRLFSHRSFQCPRWVRRVLAVLGASTLMGGPAFWAGIHRKHHQTSDQEGDPHSPNDGIAHSHFGWLIDVEGHASKNKRLALDLHEDRFFEVLDRDGVSGLPWLALVLFCYAVGGWTGVLWGACFRTVFIWHATMSINSVCHVRGDKPYPVPDNSGNVWWVAIPSFGEGWHNNHHAFPRSAICGLEWWQIDFSAYILRFLEALGLAWDAHRPSKEDKRRARQRTHALQGEPVG